MKKRSAIKVMISLAGLVKPLTGFMILAIIMGLLGHLAATFLTVFGGYALLSGLGIHTALPVSHLFPGIAVFALSRGLLRYGEQACNHYIAFKLLALIRDKVFGALRRICPAKLEGRDKGDMIAVITSDIELLEVFYAHTISPAAIAILFSGILCFFIGSYHWILGVLALTDYLIVGFVIPVTMSRKSGDNGMKFRTGSGELSSFVLESLRGLPEILQYDQGKNRLQSMNDKTDALAVEESRLKKNAGRNMALTNSVILWADLFMLFTAALLYQLGMVGFDGVLIPVIALMSSFGPCIALANLGSTLQNTFAAGNRVLDILEEEPLTPEIFGEKEIFFAGAGLEHVTFSYGQEQVLSDVSVQFPQQGIVGISGKSGCGKSTVLKLLMRFWDVKQGNVVISGTPVGKVNTANLRDMEGFMTQETQLFCDSIRNNIRLAKLDATDEEIEEACKKASVHEFIQSLPDGYDTRVGELGETLSGGERQRIGLARVFLHQAPFLLLDEPTSNLDSLNEAVILRSLVREKEGKSIALVSHRPSTMRIADKVYEMEKLQSGGTQA